MVVSGETWNARTNTRIRNPAYTDCSRTTGAAPSCVVQSSLVSAPHFPLLLFIASSSRSSSSQTCSRVFMRDMLGSCNRRPLKVIPAGPGRCPHARRTPGAVRCRLLLLEQSDSPPRASGPFHCTPAAVCCPLAPTPPPFCSSIPSTSWVVSHEGWSLCQSMHLELIWRVSPLLRRLPARLLAASSATLTPAPKATTSSW